MFKALKDVKIFLSKWLFDFVYFPNCDLWILAQLSFYIFIYDTCLASDLLRKK